jgi:VIT1/CCC1 family predicted Fe2+/Mn2+ transporter
MEGRARQMNARTKMRIGALLLPLLAALGIACLVGARAIGGMTPVTALLAAAGLALALAAVGTGAVLFGITPSTRRT